MTAAGYVVRAEVGAAWTFRVVRGARSADEAVRIVTDALGPVGGVTVGEATGREVMPPEYVIDVATRATEAVEKPRVVVRDPLGEMTTSQILAALGISKRPARNSYVGRYDYIDDATREVLFTGTATSVVTWLASTGRYEGPVST